MILTCPACDTKYVVKDGAIPAGGRQVRCASCKQSWHQMPEATDDDVMAPGAAVEPAPVEESAPPVAEVPVPTMDEASHPAPAADYEPVVDPTWVPDDGPAVEPLVETAQVEELPAEPVAVHHDDDFAFYPEDEPAPKSKRLKILLGLLVLIAIAATAAWLAAPDSLRAKLGIAGIGKSPLELMLTTSDRQQLASGNELLAISGRVINPTDQEQAVPPIRAELRNKASKKLVYSWTIDPPARSLPPGGSASFNSAEVDIPRGGDELTVTLGGRAAS